MKSNKRTNSGKKAWLIAIGTIFIFSMLFSHLYSR